MGFRLGKALYTLPSADEVTSIAFSPDGKTLATGGYDTTWKLWDISTGQKIFAAYGHTSNVIDISFDPRGWARYYCERGRNDKNLGCHHRT